jgi:hypothetical protein
MPPFLRFWISFGLSVFIITQALDFIQSDHHALSDQLAASMMPIGRN